MESGISRGGIAEVLLRFGQNLNLCQDMEVSWYLALLHFDDIAVVMRSRFLVFLACLSLHIPTAEGAEPFRPNLGPDLESILVKCGDVSLLLRRNSQWTPGRFDYLGKAMTTESSAYGTVFSIPDVGFIGTRHLENEPEPLRSLSFYADGKELIDLTEEIVAEKSFRFTRESEIRQFRLRCEWEICDNRIIETATVTTDSGGDLDYLYHFMHAWKPSVSAYVAGVDGEGVVDSGDLRDTDGERKFVINRHVDWVGVYESESGQLAVSRLLSEPENGQSTSKIWKVPRAYRKYYLTCLSKTSVPPGYRGTWKMVTAFEKCQEDEWEEKAVSLAGSLRDEK